MTCIKLPFVNKIFVLSKFEWPLNCNYIKVFCAEYDISMSFCLSIDRDSVACCNVECHATTYIWIPMFVVLIQDQKVLSFCQIYSMHNKLRCTRIQQECLHYAKSKYDIMRNSFFNTTNIGIHRLLHDIPRFPFSS